MRIVLLDADPAFGSGSAPQAAQSPISFASLEQLGELTIHQRTSPQETALRLRGAQIALTNKVVLDRPVLDSLPDLRHICVLATGTNVVDLKAATERGIVVSNVPAYSTASTAQLTLALILELCHRAGDHSLGVHSGAWSRSPVFSYWQHPLLELSGKTLGIVGYGAIGRKVSEIASAFGMHVLVHTRRQAYGGVRYVSKDELLSNSDVVTLHAPLTPLTSGFIDATALSKMRRGALLINVARGPLCVDQDVRDALDSGHLGGFAADVLTVEPPPSSHPLLGAPRTILTPHIAWATPEARQRLVSTAAKNIEAFLAGAPKNVVTPA